MVLSILRTPIIFISLFLTIRTLAFAELPIDSTQVTYRKVPEYLLQKDDVHLVLYMDYADHKIQNPLDWLSVSKSKRIYEVDIIFSEYPKRKQDWITHYDTLLRRRITELQELIPKLKTSSAVQWNIISQTACESEDDAKQMFHGVVLKLSPYVSRRTKKTLLKVKKVIDGRIGFRDSIFFNTVQRNPNWKNMLVVSDWTSSMYSYGAQVIRWHRNHFKNKKIRHFVFFNDGNHLADTLKVLGKTGGIYAVEAENIGKLMKTLKNVVQNGAGGDVPENDVEALLFGVSQYEDFDQLILIADNNSAVRDVALVDKIQQPVRVLLCALDKTNVVHPDYFTIARQTRGSLHTRKTDIWDLWKIQEGQVITIDGFDYQFKDNQFQLMR